MKMYMINKPRSGEISKRLFFLDSLCIIHKVIILFINGNLQRVYFICDMYYYLISSVIILYLYYVKICRKSIGFTNHL